MPKKCKGKCCCCCCDGKKKGKQVKRPPTAYQTFMSGQLLMSTQLLGYKLNMEPEPVAVQSLLTYNQNAIQAAEQKRAALPASERASVKMPKRIDPNAPMTFKHVWMHAVQQWYNQKGQGEARERLNSFEETEPADEPALWT